MDKKNGNLDDLTQTDCSIGCFSFDNGRTRGIMVIWLSHSSFFEFLGHPFNYFSVFCMDHGCELVFAGCQHDVEKFSVSEFESIIGHV